MRCSLASHRTPGRRRRRSSPECSPRSRVRYAAALRFAVPLPGGERPGLSRAPAISADGNTIAYAGFSAAGQALLFVRALNDLKPRPLAGTEVGIQATFSPDGEWLAFFSVGALKKIHIATGSIRTLAASNLPEGVDWGRDDQIVASVDSRLVTVPSSGGVPKPLTTLDTASGEQAQRGPHVLADGENVLFYSWRGSIEGSKVGIASMRTGIARYVDVAGAPVGVVDGLLIYATTSEALFAVPFDVRHARV